MLVANLTPSEREVVVGPLHGELSLRRLNEATAAQAASDPAAFRASSEAASADGGAGAHAGPVRGGAHRSGVTLETAAGDPVRGQHSAPRRRQPEAGRAAVPVGHRLHRGAGTEDETVAPTCRRELRTDRRAGRGHAARNRQGGQVGEAQQVRIRGDRGRRVDRVCSVSRRRVDRDRRKQQQRRPRRRVLDRVGEARLLRRRARSASASTRRRAQPPPRPSSSSSGGLAPRPRVDARAPRP